MFMVVCLAVQNYLPRCVSCRRGHELNLQAPVQLGIKHLQSDETLFPAVSLLRSLTASQGGVPPFGRFAVPDGLRPP